MDTSDYRIRQARLWRKFHRLTRGRVAVVRALRVISQEEGSGPLAEVWRGVASAVAEGNPLSEAVAGYSSVFSASVRELLKAAEKSGAWDVILPEIASGLEDGTFD